jgi:excisionase family DNA binding protein
MSDQTSVEPIVLTVEEAADLLRISRSSAYALTRRWRESQGRAGLPVVKIGGSLRVPRAALLAMVAAA